MGFELADAAWHSALMNIRFGCFSQRVQDDTPQWPEPINPYEDWQPAGTGSRTAAR